LELKDKNILLISPEPWNYIFISKHHYATHLARKRNRVFFLNPPSIQTLVKSTEYNNVFSVEYKGFIKGLRLLPNILQKYYISKIFHQLQNLCKVKFDIVWSFDNSVFFDFSALPNEVYSISHIVDLNQDFEFIKASKTANLCLGVCKPIIAKQTRYNKNTFFIQHGYNHVQSSTKNFSPALPGRNSVKAFYAGNLDIQYLDWDLIKSLIKYNKDVDFIFAGKWKNETQKENVIGKSNFFHLGVIDSENLYWYYKASDILMILYQSWKFPEQLSNTHKMMEYLGSGKMIVGTWVNEYKNLFNQKFIVMSKNRESYISSFKEVKENLHFWNNSKLIGERKKIASFNTYDKQIDRIEKIISSKK